MSIDGRLDHLLGSGDTYPSIGMHPGKAHRYLVSLTRSELVAQDQASGHYGIGAASITLGLAGLRSVNVVRTATALLPTLRDEINETVLLAMWSPQGPVVFALEESSRPVTMNVRVGSILPLLSTATDKVFASLLPYDTVWTCWTRRSTHHTARNAWMSTSCWMRRAGAGSPACAAIWCRA